MLRPARGRGRLGRCLGDPCGRQDRLACSARRCHGVQRRRRFRARCGSLGGRASGAGECAEETRYQRGGRCTDAGTGEGHPSMSGVPLVAIRHAPTAWNAERRLQGRTDVPLSPEGEAAARSWRIDQTWQGYRIIASPLARAATTAQVLFPALTIASDARLIEMSFGDWEGKSLAELRGAPGSDAESRERMGLDFQPQGGESPRQVQARIAPLLAEIAIRREPTVIVTHKAVLRALLSLATGWEMLGK